MDNSGTLSTSAVNEDWAKYIPLHRAILSADWDKAREIISKDKDALSSKIDFGGETALHVALGVAVGTPEITRFVENLLKEMNPESLQTLVNNSQFNPLHRAAVVGNIEAAKMLVDINPRLLFLFDEDKALPIHLAVYNSQKPTFVYLLGACKQHIGLCQQEEYHSPFEGVIGANLLLNVITSGFLDFAYELVKDYPHLARTMDGNFAPLEAIARMSNAYYSGTRYNFYQKFVYSYLPIKDNLRGIPKIQDIENHELYNAKFVANCKSSCLCFDVPKNFDNLGDEHRIQDTKNQEIHKTKYFVAKCKSSCFYSVLQTIYVKFWEVSLLHLSHIKHLQEEKVKHNIALMVLKCICQEVAKLNKGSDMFDHYHTAIIEAVKNDTHEAVEEILKFFPRAIWVRTNGIAFAQHAVINRCEHVYKFMVHKVNHDVHFLRTVTDEENNNLLHLAGKLAPIHKLNVVSGAALQMQRELQWFEAVTNFMHPKDKEHKNTKEETPMMMFIREHKDLRKDGEAWMKKTADSCTITATLIITIVFAAAITVPGGVDDDDGKPIYLTNPSFIIFAVSDAISLFTSTTSLLLFLSILTARYRDGDFLYRLPKRLILGLTTLFLSVTSMMVAFSATLYIMFGQGKAWILIPIATLTCLPIASFVTLQLPLLVDLISSTYGKGILDKSRDKGSK